MFDFDHEQENFDSVQSVYGSKLTTTWKTEAFVFVVSFQLHYNGYRYKFTNIDANLNILDNKELHLPKSQFGFNDNAQYYLGAKQTNCTFRNITIDMVDTLKSGCRGVFHFRHVRFTFLKAKAFECVLEVLNNLITSREK
ncbi:hypothetical protein RF11_12391 [Thelohanellus kitauei]|uniref:Uncharacterized protein n=1 Tax=Thelohanellus kitauei TaxID=669202 RepID=A0A0C2M7V2_THEKT|nr:hypothetical protein RF11_12391 [Thelohanellus kitauei]